MSDDPITPENVARVISEGRARQLDRAVDCIEELMIEQDRLRGVVEAAKTLITELDANPIGEYGDAVCEAIDVLDDRLKALDSREPTCS